jgi:hypothetical protein
MYYTPETLLNHVFEDLRKLKAPNTINQRLISSIASQEPPLAGGPATADRMPPPRSGVNKIVRGRNSPGHRFIDERSRLDLKYPIVIENHSR